MSSSDSIQQQLDEIHRKMDFRPDFEDCVLSALEEVGGDAEKMDPDTLWRMARFYHILAETIDDENKYPKKKAKEWYSVALKYAKIAVEKKPDDTMVQLWFAISVIGTIKFQSPKEQITEMHTINNALKKSLELDPKNWNAHQLQGIMAYECSQLGWLVRQAATLLFGAPPEDTLENAHAALRRCIEFNDTPEDHPIRLFSNTYMAMTLYQMKGEPGTGFGNGKTKEENRAEAKEFLERAMKIPLKGSVSRAQFVSDKVKPLMKKFQK